MAAKKPGFGVTWWGYFKGVWGVLVTLGGIYIGYQQNQIAAATVRPSLNIDITQGRASLQQQHGQLSHAFAVRNEGTVTAIDVTFTVITKQGGNIIHQDLDQIAGSLAIREEMAYAIHAHDAHGSGELIEELTVRYTGVDGWWCDQSFTYTAMYRYDPAKSRWISHPQVPASEVADCR